MKLNVGKRILMFFHWLLSLLICAAFACYIIKPELALDLYKRVTGRFTARQMMIIGIAILAIYTILTVVQACIIFHRGKRRDRGFITVDSSDTGRVRIAIPAIEQMVRESVYNIDGIADMKIAIENLDDAIGINLAATIVNGSHVPTITMNMQRAIRQFVEMNCGVAVRSVSININNVASAGDAQKRRKRKRGEPVAAQPVEPAIEPARESVPQEAPAAADQAPSYPRYEAPAEDDLPEVRPITLTLDPPTSPVEQSAETAQPESFGYDAQGDDAGEADYASDYSYAEDDAEAPRTDAEA